MIKRAVIEVGVHVSLLPGLPCERLAIRTLGNEDVKKIN